MSDSNELKPNTPAGTPVPDLIEQYRVRRDAWIAQADELARLRDEVRGSAEREAMEIVTAARRDVRQIVMEARRELLVLSAQVQAALGEAAARPDTTALLNRANDPDGGLEKPDFADAIFSHQDAVKGMLDEARADMDALAEDARTVPFQALAEPPQLPPPPELPRVFAEETLLAAPNTLPAVPPHMPASSFASATSHASSSHSPSMSTPASRTLLSSPFPSDAVPVPSSRRAQMFIGLFGVAGIAILVGTIAWLRSDKKPVATESTVQSTAPATAASKPSAVSTAATTASTPSPASVPPSTLEANTTTNPSALSLLVEARRSSWLRTTVDGESDSGRMLAQGETVRLNARQSVSLRVGDAGAVFVSVNNGRAAPLGRDGQVVTRQFVVESKERPIQNAGGSSPIPSVPPAGTSQSQKPATLPSPLAAGPPAPTPSAAAPTTPLGAVPLVQPVAATPPRPSASAPTPSLEPGPPAGARAEATAPPAATPRPELAGTASPASAVVAASRQWLDAYHRQDRASMATLQTDRLQLTDDRRTEERFPSTVNVNRTLDRVSVQIAADTAVLTAVMTERSSDNAMPPRVSPVSQVWEFRGNQWRVSQVRLTSEARLNQIFR
jgi:hypothetical protein